MGLSFLLFGVFALVLGKGRSALMKVALLIWVHSAISRLDPFEVFANSNGGDKDFDGQVVFVDSVRGAMI